VRRWRGGSGKSLSRWGAPIPGKAKGDRLEALYVLAVHTSVRQGELLARSRRAWILNAA